MTEIIRGRELAEVSGGLAQGAWFVIYAPPSSGKTTFLGQLSRQVDQAYTIKYINLRAVRGLGVGKVFGYIAGLLRNGQKIYNLSQVDKVVGFNTVLPVFRQGGAQTASGHGKIQARMPDCSPLELREILLDFGGKTLVIFDDVGTLKPEAAAALLGLLSALQSERTLNPSLLGLIVVLTSRRDLQGDGAEILSGLNSWEEYFLPDFTTTEVRYLAEHSGVGWDDRVTRYAGVSKNVGEEVWNLAEGHPWLTVYLLKQYRMGNSLAVEPEISLLQKLVAELTAGLFTGYTQGKWTSPGDSRRLRISGLAKSRDGELVVRNPIFRGAVDRWLAQGQPGGSKFLAGYEVREENLGYGSIDRAKAAVQKIDVKCIEKGVKKVIDYGTEKGIYKAEAQNKEATLLKLCLASKELTLDGNVILLTPVEYRIVEALLTNCPRILSKENLAQAAFPFEPVNFTDVESHIKNIRRKLGDKPGNPRFIRCRRGFGYQAVASSFTVI